MFTITPYGGGASRPLTWSAVRDLLRKDAEHLDILTWKQDQYVNSALILMMNFGHTTPIAHQNWDVIRWERE